MNDFNIICPDCKGQKFFIKENGSQTGLYCSHCGRWIKWLNKKEKRLYENELNKPEETKNNEIKTDSNDFIQCAACGFLGTVDKWFNTSVIGNYMCCPNCGTVRYVCKENKGFRL